MVKIISLNFILILIFVLFQNFDNAQPTLQDSLPPDYNANKNKEDAMLLIKRIAGITLPIDDPLFLEIESLINTGQYKLAAQKVTDLDEFYNITVRDFATKMSVATEVPTAPLSDFVSTIIGITRDNINAQNILTGDFFYRTEDLQGVRNSLQNDIVQTNNHYDDLDRLDINLRQTLTKSQDQKVMSNNTLVTLDEPAGVLTSRAFMMAHAYQGTNRRIIEYSFSQFLCSPITTWADASLSDAFIGRDIGRTPKVEYDSKCKTCHSPMDALRPATAYFDFTYLNLGTSSQKGFINYKTTITTDPDNFNVPADEQLIPSKFRRGRENYPQGFALKDDTWFNLLEKNNTMGWNSSEALENKGMSKFGEILANSEAFRNCMVQRVFKSICKKSLPSDLKTYKTQQAEEFKNNNYSLRSLFEDIAISPECLGVGL